jgi:uncharacterized protein (DUF2141 family)
VVTSTGGRRFTDSDLAPGTYAYKVFAIGTDGKRSAASNTAQATVNPPVETPPKVRISGVSAGQRFLTVTFTVDKCISRYRLSAVDPATTESKVVTADTTDCPSTVTRRITGLQPGTTYNVAAIGYNNEGNGKDTTTAKTND